jgi:hypothetical protein
VALFLWLKYSMDFKLYTLVDITESGVHRGPDRVAVKQQANYNSVIQTIGIRANVVPGEVRKHEGSVNKLKFGSKYKNKQAYWEMSFTIDYGATTVEMLNEDFDLIPVLDQLEETVKLDPTIFSTKNDSIRNIYFEIYDK